MAFNMDSKTKYKISEQELNKIVRFHFDEDIKSYEEIVSGFYASIYKFSLSDISYILKIAPQEGVEVLTYEKDIIRREIKVYEILHTLNIPVPKVIYTNFDRNILKTDYYIMTFIEGDNLFTEKNNIDNIEEIYKQVMKYLAEIHKKEMDHFGYDNLREYKTLMSETFILMMDNLIKDANNKAIQFTENQNKLLNLLPSIVEELDACKTPKLLHHDLWDGNILIKNGIVVGLIDAERSLNGDPLSEFAAMHLDILSDDNEYLLNEYNKYSDTPIKKTKNTYLRYYLYRMYMFFLMYVESDYRGTNGSFDDQKNWCIDELDKLLVLITNKNKE